MSLKFLKLFKIGCGILSLTTLILAGILFSTAIRLTRQVYRIPDLERQINSTASDALGPLTIPVQCPNEEGDLTPGWYRQGTNRAAVVILHGLGGNRVQLAPFATRIANEGYSVLVIDQRGHGEHPEEFTTFGRGESIDALAAVNWLRERPEIDPGRIGLFGASMGATASILAAARDEQLGGVIADSSYADFNKQAYWDLNYEASPVDIPKWSQPWIIGIFLAVSPLVIGDWANYPDPVDVIGDIKCPILLTHGEGDKRISPENMTELADAARAHGVDIETWLVPDQGHCRYHNLEEYVRRILNFYRTNLCIPNLG